VIKSLSQTQKLYISWVMALVLSTYLLWYALATKQFTWDAWTMWDIASSFSSHPYHVAGLRQYFFQTDASMSFPPLFPFLMWLINHFSHIGILSGIWINYLAVATLLPALWTLSRRISGIPELGAACFFVLISAGCAVEEFQSARTILPSLWCWVMLWSVCLDASEVGLNISRSLRLGLICGLGVMLRFDWILFGFAACFIVPLLSKSPRQILWCVGGFATATFGWMLYSEHQFGVLWASEGMLYSFVATPTYHFDFYKSGTVFVKAWQQPGLWFWMMLGQWREGLKNLLVLRYSAPVVICLGVAILRARRSKTISRSGLCEGLIPTKVMLYILLPTLIHFLTIVRHGYYQPRYLVPELVFSTLYLGRVAQNNREFKDYFAKLVLPFSIAWSVLAIVFAVHFGPNRLHNDANSYIRGSELSQDELAIQSALTKMGGLDGPASCALIFSTNTVYPQRFAALSRIRTCYDPSNSTSQVLQEFIQFWPIESVYDSSKDILKLPLAGITFEEVGSSLFRVRRNGR
jgi:hypothetical protein